MRFWPKVDIRGPEECWVFVGGRATNGYGRFDQRQAHRVAWTLSRGPIPGGLWVLHRCDNRPCCNPGHLFLGDRRDNTLDMWSKGRATPRARGEAAGRAILNRAQVLEIREAREKGEPIAVLMRRYGVAQSTISAIHHRRLWAWL